MNGKENALRAMIAAIRQGTPDDRERIEIAAAAFVHGMKIQLKNTAKDEVKKKPA